MAAQAPEGSIEAPDPFAEYQLGEVVDIVASVADEQDDAETLDVVFSITDDATGDEVASLPSVPSPRGLAEASVTRSSIV